MAYIIRSYTTQGLVNAGEVTIDQLVLTEKNTKRAASLAEQGYTVAPDNQSAFDNCDLVMLVVKPFQTDELLAEIKTYADEKRHVLVSCITGVSAAHIYSGLGSKPALFRVMPNTGISVQESMSCISAFNSTAEQKQYIGQLFEKLGSVLFIPEEQMAAATALAGCGIAFALRFIRAAIQGGVEIGFGAEDAKLMAAQIVKGAAELILENNSHPESEIDKVTTPKGITITGLNTMEHSGFSSSIIKGILASYNKINGDK